MSTNFRIVHTGVGPWRKGEVISAGDVHGLLKDGRDAHGNDVKYEQEHKDAALKRLLDLGAVEPTSDPVKIGTDGASTPEHTKGDNVDPGSDDTVEKRADRRADAVGAGNTGGPGGGDAAARANPATGKAGAVTRTTGGAAK